MFQQIFLWGLPAVGKSTWGKFFAQKFDYTFLDLDTIITSQEQMSITEIFTQKGEEYFRKLEQNFLNSYNFGNQAIIATGGGAPCYEDNAEVMLQKGFCIYLKMPLEKITNNILKSNIAQRPMFANKNKEEIFKTIEDLYLKRKIFYEKAPCQIDIQNLENYLA